MASEKGMVLGYNMAGSTPGQERLAQDIGHPTFNYFKC